MRHLHRGRDGEGVTAVKWLVRVGWMALGIAALYGASMLAGVASGGSPDPPGPPGSTMVSLDRLPPDWVQQLDASAGGCSTARFECVMIRFTCTNICFFFYDGVLDKETGLVWQRGLGNYNGDLSWQDAMTSCLNYNGGGRTGWRLPTMAEIASLIDPTVTQYGVPGFPPGAPFINIPVTPWYWATSPDFGSQTGNQTFAAYINGWGSAPGFVIASNPTDSFGALCVRGAE